jgi:hypothetical protein
MSTPPTAMMIPIAPCIAVSSISGVASSLWYARKPLTGPYFIPIARPRCAECINISCVTPYKGKYGGYSYIGWQEIVIHSIEVTMSLTESDGVFKVRTGNHSEKLLQVRASMSGEYRRFTEDNGNKIIFVKV